MFCFSCNFCCPRKKTVLEQNSMDQKLIQVGDSPKKVMAASKRLASSQSDRKKQSSHLSQKSLPISHIQKGSHYNQTKVRHLHLSGDESDIGIKPFFDQNVMQTLKHSGNGMKIGSKNRGELYDFQHNTQVVYFDTKKDDEFCLRYLINKKPNIEKQTKSILNFVLAKRSDNCHDQTQLILIIPSKVLYETKHMQIPPNVYTIFTNMRRLQKNNLVNNSSQIIQIIEGDQESIKTSAFDKIIVILEGEQDIQFIKNYCKQLAKRYSIEEFLKIWWVFPSFMGLEDISDIIKQTLRKFVINDKVQNIAKYLYYEIDVAKQLNLQTFVLVRNKKWRDFNDSDTKNRSKDYESQICLAIGLLMVEMNETVLPYYKYFLQNELFEMKFRDYIKYRSLLQNQKQNFFKKLIFYNLVTEEGAKVLQENRRMIEYKYGNPDHRRFTIKNSAKRKFVAAFGFQESVQTGEGSTPVQQEWDDNLKLQDLQMRKGSWDKQSGSSPDNDLNLIDQAQIQNIEIKQLVLDGEQLNFQNSMNISQAKSLNVQDQTAQLDINILETKQTQPKINQD